jgi:hypothetical protein
MDLTLDGADGDDLLIIDVRFGGASRCLTESGRSVGEIR